jgi:hypothetical protein
MALLELNLRAKKAKPPTPPPTMATAEGLKLEGLKLEVGKKYITNEGVVLGPMLQETEFPNSDHLWMMAIYPDGLWTCHWEIAGGEYVGGGMTHKRSIRREWTPTWELEEAWMRGEKLEVFIEGEWKHWFIHSYPVICGAFGGPDKPSAKTWWALRYADACIKADGTFRVRRKP